MFLNQILQPAKADIIMIMDNNQQKLDVRISDIIVSIAPAAVKTLIGVTSSLGTLQVNKNLLDMNYDFHLCRQVWKKKKKK